MYDVVIIGLGPAGVAAAVYAGRKKLNTLIIGKDIGGQSVVSHNIQNWIGIPSISGVQMAMQLDEHLETVKDNVKVDMGAIVEGVEKIERDGKTCFQVQTENNKYETKTILVASGSGRRKLGIPGERVYSGKGVFYCSICDAPLMNDKNVAVIGGGNAGLEAILDLIPYASKIYLMEVTDQLRGDKTTQEKVGNSGKVNMMFKVSPVEIIGEQFVNGIKYEDIVSREIKELAVDGIFIEIGSTPNSSFMKGLVDINKFGEIEVDPLSGKTSQDGIWAAGDVTMLPYKQNNTAIGDAVRAILNIYDHFIKG